MSQENIEDFTLIPGIALVAISLTALVGGRKRKDPEPEEAGTREMVGVS